MKYKRIFFSGGLGNQMFLYAFLMSLRSKGYVVRINNYMYDLSQQHNGYELDSVFNIIENIEENNKYQTYWYRLLHKYPSRFRNVFFDLSFKYDPYVWDESLKYYFGCYINPQYFEDIADRIRLVFTFKNYDRRNLDIIEQMKKSNSVSIHIRRGDYLLSSKYAVCKEQYYIEAISKIMELVERPFFYVFSDDTFWSNEFMKSCNVDYQIIEHNKGVDSYKDMLLMSKCKHNIIANSTFSWWGGWLNEHPNKIVVAPKIWMKGKTETPNCNNWLIINNTFEL